MINQNLKTLWETTPMTIKELAQKKYMQLKHNNPTARAEQIADRMYSFFYNEIGVYSNDIERYIDEICGVK